MPSFVEDRNLGTDLILSREIQRGINNRFFMLGRRDDIPPRPNHCRVSPRLVTFAAWVPTMMTCQ
eukprot:COSAG05_NODE_745_length_7575_cov_3.254013_2_plen_65_part_00